MTTMQQAKRGVRSGTRCPVCTATWRHVYTSGERIIAQCPRCKRSTSAPRTSSKGKRLARIIGQRAAKKR